MQHLASFTQNGARYPASSTTTSPALKKTCTSHCTLQCVAQATSQLKCKFVLKRCTKSPKKVSPLTGCTKKAKTAYRRSTTLIRRCRGFDNFSTGSVRFLATMNTSPRLKPTFCKTKYSSTHPRATSKTFQQVQRLSTSLTAFTPTSGTTQSVPS